MDKSIIDGMKNESKIPRNVMIWGYIDVILLLLVKCLTKEQIFDNKEIILHTLTSFLFGSIGLYCWLYGIKYRVEINKEKIMLKTLFNKTEIQFNNIVDYTCKRYRKSVFYQFRLYTKENNVLLNTRYRNEFIEMLKANNINEKQS